MPSNPLQLIAAQQLTNAYATYYTSTKIKTRIDALSVTNTTGSAATLTFNIVATGGSAIAANTIISALSIPAGYTWNGAGVVGQIMAVDDFLSIKSGTSSALTIMASGTQVS